MTRSTFEQFITLISGAVAGGTDPAARQDVEERDTRTPPHTFLTKMSNSRCANMKSTAYIFHLYRRSEGIAAVVVTDREYPNRVVHKLLSQVADDFLTLYTPAKWAEGAPTLDVPQFKEYIVKYQDPRQADSLIKIQLELDETKIVLHKTIESVLERGEKIDDLVSRSESLSAASKMFYTQVWTIFSGFQSLQQLEFRGLISCAYRPRSRTRAA